MVTMRWLFYRSSLVLCLSLLVLVLPLYPQQGECHQQQRSAYRAGHDSFVRAKGTHFVAEGNGGKPLYFNGFNSYWLIYMASDPSQRDKVTTTLQQASKSGMNLVRTWAFSDGGYKPLQSSPGSYNEDMFKGLDFVISEARRNRIYLILSLVNNYEDMGGRKQYVQWARDIGGQYLNSDDDFYTNSVVKGYYKNHAKTVLTRINTITGVAYKDDSTILAWELMNEPRCQSDLSGRIFQDWISEMASHIKSIDSNHLLEVGLEGFYGEINKQKNPRNYSFGTDFISNNQVPGIDFTTIHLYSDQWLLGSSEEAQSAFVDQWVEDHIQDSDSVLQKPLLIAEFGKSSRASGYNVAQRDAYFAKIYNAIYENARGGGPYAGGLFWQVMAQGMDSFGDGYEVILGVTPSTDELIHQQSRKLSTLS